MALTESIPLQEKIAELERRIEALEKAKTTQVTVTRTRYSNVGDGGFGVHWDKMWAEFHEMMREVFK